MDMLRSAADWQWNLQPVQNRVQNWAEEDSDSAVILLWYFMAFSVRLKKHTYIVRLSRYMYVSRSSISVPEFITLTDYSQYASYRYGSGGATG